MRYRALAIAASAVIASGWLAACHNPQSLPDKGAITRTINGQVSQLIADFNAHDAAKAVSQDAPDYVGMFHGMANVYGPAGDMTLTRLQVADPAARVTVTQPSVDVSSAGDLAVWRATYAYNTTDPATKRTATEHGNWLLAYKLQPDKTWKIAWSVVSDTGPGPSP